LLENNEKVTIVWPSDDTNPSFDCLILFAKEYAFFCQITVRDDLVPKIREIFGKTKFEKYLSIFKKLEGEGYKVCFVLIHGNHEKNEYEDRETIAGKSIDCYSFKFIGEQSIFGDGVMEKIHELKNVNKRKYYQENESKAKCLKN